MEIEESIAVIPVRLVERRLRRPAEEGGMRAHQPGDAGIAPTTEPGFQNSAPTYIGARSSIVCDRRGTTSFNVDLLRPMAEGKYRVHSMRAHT
jgi:hypothetical protein